MILSFFSRGLGLGAGLRHAIFASGPKAANQSCAQPSTARLSHLVQTSPILEAARNLHTSARLHAAKKKTPALPARKPDPPLSLAKPKKKPASPPGNTERTARTPRIPPKLSKEEATQQFSLILTRLAVRSKPKVLYESASHFWFAFSSCSAAFFCFLYAAINCWNIILHPPEGIATWVPHGFAVICLFMGGIGLWYVRSTAYIVRRITMLPPKLYPESYRQALLKNRSRTTIPFALECEVSSVLPFLPTKKIMAMPGQVVVPFYFYETPVAEKAKNAERPKRAPPADFIGKIAVPFESLGDGVASAFSGLKRGILRTGFAPIKINGRDYKIDIMDGKVADEGWLVDHVVAYRPELFSKMSLKDRLYR